MLDAILGPDLSIVLHIRLLEISVLGLEKFVLLHQLLPSLVEVLCLDVSLLSDKGQTFLSLDSFLHLLS